MYKSTAAWLIFLVWAAHSHYVKYVIDMHYIAVICLGWLIRDTQRDCIEYKEKFMEIEKIALKVAACKAYINNIEHVETIGYHKYKTHY